jgi:hypothetical protein
MKIEKQKDMSNVKISMKFRLNQKLKIFTLLNFGKMEILH